MGLIPPKKTGAKRPYKRLFHRVPTLIFPVTAALISAVRYC